ncbi:MAG TPA: ELWxxDGT repeat protein [Thermoanaerobaculia bacterium]|nr:ELWxxDGT repeat protein [Thermoanaerobaculia bacterium]
MCSVLRFVVLPLAGALAAMPGLAASASLARDINARPQSLPMGKGAQQLVAAGDKVLFVGSEPSSGQEVWASDGTPEGTELLVDIFPGPPSPTIQMLGSVGRVAFFFARDVESERLWRSDGTRAGTYPLADDLRLHLPFVEHAVTSRALFFVGCPELDCEIWTSDGTVAGTKALTDHYEQGFHAPPSELTAFSDTLYFEGPSPEGRAVWKTDGTAAGLVRLGIFNGFRQPSRLTVAGSRLFFIADAGQGQELWVSDGTPAGTRRVTDFAAAEPFWPSFLEPAGSAVYFQANGGAGNVLWRSDGTLQGTRRVTDFTPFDFYSDQTSLEPIGDRLLFLATTDQVRHTLWTTGGTLASTQPLAGCPGGCPFVVQRTPLLRVGGRVLLFGRDVASGTTALWSSDATGAGTRKVRDLCQGDCAPSAETIALAGGRLYFISFEPPDGMQLWTSDGTPGGTRSLLSLAPHPLGDAPRLEAVAAGGRTYFGAQDREHGTQLWKTDDTPSGTEVVSTFGLGEPSSDPEGITPFGNGVLFWASDGELSAFWTSDGTAAGTRPLSGPSENSSLDRPPPEVAVLGDRAFALASSTDSFLPQLWRIAGGGSPAPLTAFTTELASELVVHQGKLLFAVSAAEGSSSFWSSDGTAAGTGKLFDLPTGVEEVSHLASLGGELYFVALERLSHGRQVWRSDGTAVGTRRLTAFERLAIDDSPHFTRLGGHVYFLAGTDSNAGAELWRTDGTAAGTALVVPHTPAARAEDAKGLVPFGGALYFFANLGDFRGGRGLWRSDGTAAGTVLVAEVAPTLPFGQVPQLAVAGPRLFFVADDGVHGSELWVTDGTAAGTVLVRNVAPGERGSGISGLAAAGGRVFFAATDGGHGFELWESDGTAAGTRMVQDLAPGGLSSQPGELTASGGRLFFAADDGVWGRELWSYPLGEGPGCQASATSLCLAGGRYKVEAHWRDFAGNSGVGRAVALTADTGYFWFFDAANVEVIVKVLAAEGVNGHTWVFYGALSSVEYTLTVTDTQTGAARRYVNPASRLGSVADTRAFGPLGATPSSLTFGPEAEPVSAIVAARRRSAAATAPCVPGPTRLCLNGGRFAVEARWRAQGKEGVGTAVPLTGDTGYFWFFGAANVEIVLKVLDGRPLNGKFWVFYGALSDVAYTLTVTDTQTGESKTYENPQGRLASVADTGAF